MTSEPTERVPSRTWRAPTHTSAAVPQAITTLTTPDERVCSM